MAVAVPSVLSARSPADPTLDTRGRVCPRNCHCVSQAAQGVKNRGHFPSDEAATKLIYLAFRNITESWRNRHQLGGWPPINSPSNSGRDLTNEADVYDMEATRP